MPKKYLCYCDGACEPVNPGGVATYGAVIFDADTWKEEWSAADVVCEGPGATNNVAEYAGMLAILKELVRRAQKGDSITVKTDSKLVVNQISGGWRINAPHLRVLVDEARTLLRSIRCLDVNIGWVPRTENTVADMLSKRAYIDNI